MSNISPFLQTKVECPICKTVNEYEQIKVGAYTEGSRDTDFCPLEINWRNPKYQAYNPLVFFTATCSNCFYTRELTSKFKDWKNDTAYRSYQLKTIKAKHLEQLSIADSVIKQLGSSIDINAAPNESAIIKIHLAIYDSLLADHPSSLDIGRFYIRLAWLYREMGRGEDPSKLLIKGMIRDIEENKKTVFSELTTIDKAICEMKDTVNSQFELERIPAEIQARILTYRERFDSEINEIGTAYRNLQEKLDLFETLLHEYRSDILGANVDGDELPFGKYPSLSVFLEGQKPLWEGIAVNEHEAMEHAIHHYKTAFESGRDITAGVAQMQASYLIAELSRRIEDHDGAKQYFTNTIKSGQEFVYSNRSDPSRTALARKILELAIEQGRENLAAIK